LKAGGVLKKVVEATNILMLKKANSKASQGSRSQLDSKTNESIMSKQPSQIEEKPRN